MKIYDLQNKQQDAAWLAKNYGTVFTQGESIHCVAELREAEGEPVLTVTVQKDGVARAGVEVKCFFFGYEMGMLTGHTYVGGTVTFPLPRVFTYKLSGYGTHWVSIGKIGKLRVIGLGVPEGVPGWRHLDVVFEEAA